MQIICIGAKYLIEYSLYLLKNRPMQKSYIYLLFFMVLTLASCVDKPTYPSQPVIAYKDFIKYGDPADPDSLELVVSFTDNEGDIGLAQSDNQGIFNSGNLYMTYYFWDTSGVDHWTAYDLNQGTGNFDTLIYPFRVPLVLPEGSKDQPMKGYIFAKINTTPFPPYKRFKYVVYLYDRAMHRSDTIHTPALTFP